MRPVFTFLVGSLLFFGPKAHSQTGDEGVEQVAQFFDHVLTEGQCYPWLHHLCKEIGHRVAGSSAGAAAVEYSQQILDSIGCDKVWTQEVEVRHWSRGSIEKCKLIQSKTLGDLELSVVALGYSAPTPKLGLSAEVIEVKSVEDLRKLPSSQVKGKFVFFNGPMDPTKINTFHAYGAAGSQRTSGPKVAAQKGAVGALVRSLTLKNDDVPHSGVTIFQQEQPIPAAALGIQSADKLSALLAQEPKAKVYLQLNCQDLGKRKTYNVIGEIKGSDYPDEIIVVGGHLDSWDLGEGAHDDGAGCVHAMQVLHSFKALGIRPKHTIRCVLFANEESGLAGGRKYAAEAERKGEKHIAAIESDGGGHAPRGFAMDALPHILQPAYAKAQNWRALVSPYGFYELTTGGSGADISPLKKLGVVLFGFRPDSQRYFDYHHSSNDVFENVHRRELELGAAGIAAWVYLIDQYGLQ
ncbi:M20/M25/M40 family metallo-hydrolase [Saprospira sp. CCB-QB6]|uniref:M20/M25/M40 family metallo-hydrolase n=1 Tax=Saprospira sp. CCB-QB6 TaxID=3023936 RepID=UPI002349AA38|nr:M20/M25/M40 family metallo-hydrolase [Saprospira sp. CCB-QB6]WCL80522.1 M20/M25/M40 family metallo-hydrolase [Saprospira sp. CCB-QB6]